MLELLKIEDGAAWVETDCGDIFKIVNAFKVLDEDDEVFSDSVNFLEAYTEIEQDYELEANIISVFDVNDGIHGLIVTRDGVEIEA